MGKEERGNGKRQGVTLRAACEASGGKEEWEKKEGEKGKDGKYLGAQRQGEHGSFPFFPFSPFPLHRSSLAPISC